MIYWQSFVCSEIENVILGDNIYIGDGDIFASKINRSSDSAFVINYAAYGIVGVLATINLVYITAKIISGCCKRILTQIW